MSTSPRKKWPCTHKLKTQRYTLFNLINFLNTFQAVIIQNWEIQTTTTTRSCGRVELLWSRSLTPSDKTSTCMKRQKFGATNVSSFPVLWVWREFWVHKFWGPKFVCRLIRSATGPHKQYAAILGSVWTVVNRLNLNLTMYKISFSPCESPGPKRNWNREERKKKKKKKKKRQNNPPWPLAH